MLRRNFIKKSAFAAGLIAGAQFPLLSFDGSKEIIKLTILHTNDQHSRIDAFPMDGGRNQGLGGFAKRAALVNKIRKDVTHSLLLDSGDIFQGTPYFNVFHGELEIKLMSELKYDFAVVLLFHSS